VFFPDFQVVDLWAQKQKLFVFFLIPVEGKDETENSPDDEDIAGFLALFNDSFDDFAACPCT